jgi:nucleolin
MVFSDNSSLSKAMELSGSDLGGFSLFVDEAKPRSDNRDGAVSNDRGRTGRARSDDRGGRIGRARSGDRGGRSGRSDNRGRRGRSFGRGDRGGGSNRGRSGAPHKQSALTASTGNFPLILHV